MNILNLIEQYLVQVIDLQVFALPRITLKPLVPSFPCFAKIVVWRFIIESINIYFGDLYFYLKTYYF
jgi:hypothetical protein